jgi:uncharacterized protein involved in response to NO
MKQLIIIEEAARDGASGARPAFALWQLGFRPFYLLASTFAALSIALWALQFSGLLGGGWLAGPLWHAHEMLFGFALAVIVGFLFTAGRNWTSQPTPTGPALMALCALWLAARVLGLTPFAVAAALADVAFPVAAAIGLAIPLWKARNRRNYFFVGLLLVLAGASATMHLDRLGWIALPGWASLALALDVVLFILCVMGGRVIPMFTNNGVPGTKASRDPRLEKAALGLILALAIADVAGAPAALVAAVAGSAAVAHGCRWLLWQPWRTGRVPLVWVLHAAYLWIPLHLALRSLAALGLASPSAAAHGLTTGAIGGLVIGMMTRTSRGHTGRPLRADRVDVACYLLVLGAALVRVGLPLAAPALTLPAVKLSAALWSAGFGLFALRYWPALSRARSDGKPG